MSTRTSTSGPLSTLLNRLHAIWNWADKQDKSGQIRFPSGPGGRLYTQPLPCDWSELELDAQKAAAVIIEDVSCPLGDQIACKQVAVTESPAFDAVVKGLDKMWLAAGRQ